MHSTSYQSTRSGHNSHFVEEGKFQKNYSTSADENEDLNVDKSLLFQGSLKFVLLIGLSAAVIVFSIISSASFSHDPKSHVSSVIRSSSASSDSLLSYVIEVAIESPGYPKLSSLALLPWDAVAEPHKDQTLSIKSFNVDGNVIDLSTSNDYQIFWTIGEQSYSGYTTTIHMQDVGIYTGVVEVVPLPSSPYYGRVAKDPTSVTTLKKKLSHNYKASRYVASSAAFVLNFDVASKYVRREIRTLSESDRNTFLDTMQTLWTLSEVEGQTKYGQKYHSAAYFAYEHLSGAGTSDCDHWHDGAGIMTHHIGFTLQFEQALQSIDKSLSLPYWEYVMDTYANDYARESNMFQANWFGQIDNAKTEDHRIMDGGRWDSLQISSGSDYLNWDMSSTGTLNPFVNAYGDLRSPWNSNPSTYVGRWNLTYSGDGFSTFPSCSDAYTTFVNTSLSFVR